jgi:uncharacterized protein
MSPRIVAAILLSFPLLISHLSAEEWEVPLKLTRRVTDLTQTLTQAEINTLDGKLAQFEDTTSTQIVVVMVSTIGETPIEEAALRVAEENSIGRKGKDNGALLFIAKNDRRMRIEVGYGLEGALPDALAGQIIRKEITPWFRQGNFYAGIDAGITAMMAATQYEYKADGSPSGTARGLSPFVIILLVFFFMLMLRRRSKSLRGGGLPIFFPGGIPRSGGWGSGGGGWGGGGFSGGGGSFGGGGASGGW